MIFITLYQKICKNVPHTLPLSSHFSSIELKCPPPKMMTVAFSMDQSPIWSHRVQSSKAGASQIHLFLSKSGPWILAELWEQRNDVSEKFDPQGAYVQKLGTKNNH